jgi:predicted O-methyltransferase YrrM
VIHDDGWFAAQPAYYDRLAQLLRPGGLLVMSNWFLLEHAVTGASPIDWAQFAGPRWADDIQAYAHRLANDDRYDVSFVQSPAFALAYRRTDA